MTFIRRFLYQMAKMLQMYYLYLLKKFNQQILQFCKNQCFLYFLLVFDFIYFRLLKEYGYMQDLSIFYFLLLIVVFEDCAIIIRLTFLLLKILLRSSVMNFIFLSFLFFQVNHYFNALISRLLIQGPGLIFTIHLFLSLDQIISCYCL